MYKVWIFLLEIEKSSEKVKILVKKSWKKVDKKFGKNVGKILKVWQEFEKDWETNLDKTAVGKLKNL